MAVLFLDTDAELWWTTAKELGFEVIKMPYTLDETEYLFDSGETTDFKGFYKRMREGAVPITSALNAENYKEIFEPVLKKGEEIFYISFSAELSGTFAQYDVAVKELTEIYPDAKITRFDTRNISMGAGIQAYLAGKFFNAGHTVEETFDYLGEISKKVTVRFIVDDMVYLKRGGRISATKATLGSVFKIKPVIKVTDDGKLDVCAKLTGVTTGSKKALNYLIDEIKKSLDEDFDAPIVVVNADDEEASAGLTASIREAYPDKEIWEQPVGPVIGAHCGPGTIGLIFISK
ncbi:MAG: DegV family protein [Clostridiaceae bacterium]|jgi:DegV family protein with EDD domain|nr:DegV family protein [Clostridiaceae bacterium]